MENKAQTVLGLVDPQTLGGVLTHEHLLIKTDKTVFKTEPPSWLPQSKLETFNLENLAAIRQYPYSSNENMEFAGEAVMQAVTEELKYLKGTSCGTIVENSSIGLRTENHASFLKKVSEETGVQIIAGAGFYVTGAQKHETLQLTQEAIENMMRQDVLIGMDGTNVKCGVIGEIGCTWPLHPFEKKVLKSAASVQSALNCPVIIHPGRNKNAPDEIMRTFLEAGGIADKTVMSHLDRTLFQEEELAEFASSAKCLCEFDLFGIEVSHYQLSEEVDMPSDSQRIIHIRYLIEQGFEDMIVISHDIHTKHRLKKFGGHGYSHIFENVVPKMHKRGIASDIVDKILIHNPKRWLTFGKSDD